jgi:hypothetical protein
MVINSGLFADFTSQDGDCPFLRLDFFFGLVYIYLMNYSQQLLIIKNLIPNTDVDTRMDCPFCHNTNTLTIKKNNADLMWYCFHASCSAKGKHQDEVSMEQIMKNVNVVHAKEKEKVFTLPSSFISIHSEPKCVEYLRKNNCLKVKEKGKASFMYDVKQHRIVFLIKEKEKVKGAIGRGLNSNVYSGVALMGTSLPDSFIPIIRKKFKEVIVALDRDATTKAFDISNKLSYYIPTKVKMLQDDLKYFNEQQIESILQ